MAYDFNLKNTLSRSNNVDLDDVLTAKSAFRDLGYYETPRYGMTPYPDEPLFAGIEAFQKDHRLAVDGIMKPGGPTARRLGLVMETQARPTIAGRNPPPRRTMDYRLDRDGPPVIRLLDHGVDPDGPHDRPEPHGPNRLPGQNNMRMAANAPTPTARPNTQAGPSQAPFTEPPHKPLAPHRGGPGGSSISQRFRDELHKWESIGGANKGYAERNSQGYLGRYQLGDQALQGAGLKDGFRNWTGKYGIKSDQDFLSNPDAQEMALVDYLRDLDKQLDNHGSKKLLGKSFNGLKGSIRITTSGLLAAAHRKGARAVREYLNEMKNGGWDSRSYLGHPKEATFKAIETRLRVFQNIPVRKKP